MPRVNSSMTIVVIIVSLVILGIFNIALADPDPANNQSDFSIKHGTKALQFQLGSAFSIRTDQSLTLAYKYFLSPRSALRFGIGLSDNFETRDSKIQTFSYSDSTVFDNKRDEDSDNHSIGVTIQYLKIHQISPKLNFLFGIGPYFGFTRTHNDYKQTPTDSTWTKYDYTSTSKSPGISCTFGAEWFISQRISLSADYGIALSYSRRTQEETRDESDVRPPLTTKYTVNAFGWNSMATNVGVSVYF
jgi:hypothetical protein